LTFLGSTRGGCAKGNINHKKKKTSCEAKTIQPEERKIKPLRNLTL